MEERYIYNFSTQERMKITTRKEENHDEVKSELELVKEELDFYKSLFKTHHNSVVFNLMIKKKDGKNVWVDPVRDDVTYIESLDRDQDVEEWLEPVKPSR